MSTFPNLARARVTLAENLRVSRVSKGLSQERLAELAGFHRTYVSQIERCTTNVSLENLQKVADVLEVEVWQLLKPEQ
jgi:transcriptional regulator with XRE-family HTH domain